MTQFLLDTSVIVDILNNKRNRVQLVRELLVESHTIACCSVNIAEVYAGMRPKEKLHTEALLNSLYCYEITRTIAAQAGTLKSEWSQRGVTLSIADTIIAAVVLANKLTLITDNIKHYPMPAMRKFKMPE